MPHSDLWKPDVPTPTPTETPISPGATIDLIWPVVINPESSGMGSWLLISFGGILVLLGLGAIVLLVMRRKENEDLDNEFAATAASAITSVEATLRPSQPSLEEEIFEVSKTLFGTVSRMREIIGKAVAFEDEVRLLVRQADAARAAASLDEEQARQISVILGERTEQKFKEEIRKLTTTHAGQVEKLRKSGTRTALWTFIAGSVIGFLLNILAGLIVN